jgi:hypothetical protein
VPASGGWLDGDVLAEGFELLDLVARAGFVVAAPVEVVGAELDVEPLRAVHRWAAER